MNSLNRELAESLDSFLQLINRWMKFMHKRYINEFEHQAITQSQYRVLYVLNNSGPYKMSELSEIVHTSYGSLTVMIDRLIDKGFVERFYLPEDRRVVMVKITSRGMSCLNEYRNEFLDLIVKNLERLTDEEKRKLQCSINEVKSIIENNSDLFQK